MKTAIQIVKAGWNGMNILVHKDTGKAVVKGEVVKNFRGEIAKVVGGRAPRHQASEGYVGVAQAEGGVVPRPEVYAGCYGLEWRQAEGKVA